MPSPRLARRLAIVAVVAVVLAATVAFWSREGSRPKVILIVVDTLRNDHLSLAGYARETSPDLEELARRGTHFTRFYSHAAATRPSIATLLTSRHIAGHGIVSQWSHALPASLTSLPEVLQQAGYRTSAFITNPQIHSKLGFARGFDRFEELFRDGVDPAQLQAEDIAKPPAEGVFARVVAAMEADGDDPSFAYVHLLEPHGPYAVTAEETVGFVDPAYEGSVRGTLADFRSVERLAENARDLRHFVGHYDAEVARVDRAIGDFVRRLAESGRLADTHVIITADHGEELLDHGEMGHGLRLYEESIRVPFLWLGPGVPAGRRVDALAGLVDVLPTLVDVLDLEVPAPMEGRSLRPLWTNDGAAAPRRDALFLEGLALGSVDRDGAKRPLVTRGLVTETGKLIARECVFGEPTCTSYEVFDLRTDPGEKRGREVAPAGGDLTPEERRLVDLFRKETAASLGLAIGRPAAPGAIPEADVERLESLGYVQERTRSAPAPTDWLTGQIGPLESVRWLPHRNPRRELDGRSRSASSRCGVSDSSTRSTRTVGRS